MTIHLPYRSSLQQSVHFLFVLIIVLFLQEFIEQFGALLPKNATAFKEDISALFEKKMGLDPTTYQIGKTKVHH